MTRRAGLHVLYTCVPTCVPDETELYSTQWEQYLTQEIVDEMVGGYCCAVNIIALN